jgi:hypothetical protein
MVAEDFLLPDIMLQDNVRLYQLVPIKPHPLTFWRGIEGEILFTIRL